MNISLVVTITVSYFRDNSFAIWRGEDRKGCMHVLRMSRHRREAHLMFLFSLLSYHIRCSDSSHGDMNASLGLIRAAGKNLSALLYYSSY